MSAKKKMELTKALTVIAMAAGRVLQHGHDRERLEGGKRGHGCRWHCHDSLRWAYDGAAEVLGWSK